MGRCPTSNHAGKIPGDDDFCCGSADASLWLFTAGIDTTRPHVTHMTAEPFLAKSATGFLLVRTVPNGFYTFLSTLFNQMINRSVNAFFFHFFYPGKE
jgi:hypothetical protein